MAAKKWQQVSRDGVGKEQLLSLNTAGRIDPHVQPLVVPLAQRRRNILEDMGLKLAAFEAVAPDQTLQLLQSGGLGVQIHQPQDFAFDDRLGARLGLAQAPIPQGVIARVDGDLIAGSLHLVAGPLLPQKRLQLPPDVGNISS